MLYNHDIQGLILFSVSPGSRYPYTAALTTLTLSTCKDMYDKLPENSEIRKYVRIEPPVLCAAVGENGEDACKVWTLNQSFLIVLWWCFPKYHLEKLTESAFTTYGTCISPSCMLRFKLEQYKCVFINNKKLFLLFCIIPLQQWLCVYLCIKFVILLPKTYPVWRWCHIIYWYDWLPKRQLKP